MFKKFLRNTLELCGLEIKRLEGRKNTYVNRLAWDYQSGYVLPSYKETDQVIDVGCGGAPSPIATVLTDYFPDYSIHRARPVVEDRPLIVCSADRMPIRDKFFDLSICSHVLEHVSDPASAAVEIARVSQKGYIETPAYGKDVLIGTGHQHIWQVVSNLGALHFFPYTKRQHVAHAESPFMSIWCQEKFHPWQVFFWERQDIFNAIQFWEDAPQIFVHGGQPSRREITLPEWKPVVIERLPNIPPALSDHEISLLEACLIAPDGGEPMRYKHGEFVDLTGLVRYPVRGKRIYFEAGSPIS
jgi:SAM-dependent methyltransferase